ncbi:biotin carboxylase N-terminal domain-containing protein [Microtetraspora sp. AC03309]|uniref:biotin carboxylase N-terminal domain-containing protein n=1 Tax=Microtetraspora sp. AC03309 TaxID=2779376 RepID=UPI001E5FD26E|nr:biotin carboxylase N-terminal domain-containing protein [Microtetraspora sp. AC03309]
MFESVLVADRGEIARRIIRTARRMGLRAAAVYSDADADLPFARAVVEAGLVWIGPAPEAIVRMGDKINARSLMENAGVPVATGTRAPVTGLADAVRVAAEIGRLPRRSRRGAQEQPALLRRAVGPPGVRERGTTTPGWCPA